MSKRTEALWRIWAFVWQGTIGYLALIVMGTIAFVFGVIDVLWQLLAGSDGLSESGTVGSHIGEAFSWSVGQTVYALTGGGDGSFRWFWTM